MTTPKNAPKKARRPSKKRSGTRTPRRSADEIAEGLLDHPEERAFEALSDRIGDLESWRASMATGRKPWQDDFELLVKSIHDLRVDLIRGVTQTTLSTEAQEEIIKIAELKAMNLGPSTFHMVLDEWRAQRDSR